MVGFNASLKSVPPPFPSILNPPTTLINVELIGVGRFRIMGGGGGGQGLEYWRGQGGGGANSQQAHDVVMTSMRRNDVASTSFRRHVPTRFLINQCQIITFLIKI